MCGAINVGTQWYDAMVDAYSKIDALMFLLCFVIESVIVTSYHDLS